MRKPGLSRDEHTELGAELAVMRDRLGVIAVLLGNAYPATMAHMAIKAQRDLDRLRSRLDDEVFREFPKLSRQGNATLYFPNRER